MGTAAFIFINVQDWLQLIALLILFIVVLFGAVFTTKFIGKLNLKRGVGKNMQLLEAISVGPQKVLQLIKVGEEIILIAISKDRITFIKEIKKDDIDLNIYNAREKETIPFSKQLDKFIKKEDNK